VHRFLQLDYHCKNWQQNEMIHGDGVWIWGQRRALQVGEVVPRDSASVRSGMDPGVVPRALRR
jgi:hypothetical protein